MTTIRIAVDEHILIVGRELIDILDPAGIAPGPDVVGRVRDVIRRLDAVTLDRDNLVKTLETVRGERDAIRDTLEARAPLVHPSVFRAFADLIAVSGYVHPHLPWRAAERFDNALKEIADCVAPGAHGQALQSAVRDLTLTGRVNPVAKMCHAVIDEVSGPERAPLLERIRGVVDALKRANDSESRWEATIRQLRDERDGACDDLHKRGGAAMSTLAEMVREVCEDLAHVKAEALRPNLAGPVVEWRGRGGLDLFVDGEFASQVCVGLDGKPWRLMRGISWIGHATDEVSVRRLAELLAGHDPGGRWTHDGMEVPKPLVTKVASALAVEWVP